MAAQTREELDNTAAEMLALLKTRHRGVRSVFAYIGGMSVSVNASRTARAIALDLLRARMKDVRVEADGNKFAVYAAS